VPALLLLLAMMLAAPARAEAPVPPRELLSGAVECGMAAADFATAWGCARALADRPELRDALRCVLRGDAPEPCLGLREAGFLAVCTKAAGWSAEALAACVALRLAAAEAAKCLDAGLGAPGGCFGPGNTLRRWGEAAWEWTPARLRAGW
jgi:hypothetical protein